jgi:WD40 repeat protein
MNPGLDGLYAQTLARSERLPHFLTIISTIALLREPLPTSGIAELLGIRTYEVVNVLVNLQAIIQVPGTDDIPVTVCHTSLRDFLTTESRSVRYFAPPRHHVHVFFRCVEIGLEFYRRNLGERSSFVRGSRTVYHALGSSYTHLHMGSPHLKLSDWDFSAPLRRRVLEFLPTASRDLAEALHQMTRLLASLLWRINVESLPSDMKKEGVGWYASFHPKPVPTGTAKRKKPFDVELVHTLGIPFLNHSDSGFVSAKFSTDGKFLVVRCADRSAYIYDTQTEMMTGTLVQDLPFSRWPLAIGPLALGVSPGVWFVTEGDDGIIRVSTGVYPFLLLLL